MIFLFVKHVVDDDNWPRKQFPRESQGLFSLWFVDQAERKGI